MEQIDDDARVRIRMALPGLLRTRFIVSPIPTDALRGDGTRADAIQVLMDIVQHEQ
jgi:hypothetical protein